LPGPGFGERALQRFVSYRIEGMGRMACWNLPGWNGAALVIAFPGLGAGERPGEEGPAALLLALVAADMVKPPGSREHSAVDSGIRPPSLEAGLVDLGQDSLGIVIEGNCDDIFTALPRIGAALRSPAFLAEGFPDEAFQSSLRDLRLAERGRALAAASAAVPAAGLGSEKGLRSLDLRAIRAYWKANLRLETIAFAAVGAFDPAALAKALGAATGEASARPFGPAPMKANSGIATIAQAGPASPAKGAVFLAIDLPRESLQGTTGGAVAIIMELLSMSALHGEDWRWRLEGRGLRLEPVIAGQIAPRLEAFRQGLDRLERELDMRPVSSSPGGGALNLARAKALARLFDGPVPHLVAVAMASDLASGGDGGALFALASEIEGAGEREIRAASVLLEARTRWSLPLDGSRP
jgi:hypothetical protein